MIVGRLIPAGTGLAYHRARRDKEMFEAAEREALALLEAQGAIETATEGAADEAGEESAE